MSVHFIDNTVFGDSVGTADMRQIFSEVSTFQRWLDVEVALARAQASMGMIPPEAAEIIAAKADASLLDLEAVKASGKRTGHRTCPPLMTACAPASRASDRSSRSTSAYATDRATGSGASGADG